MLFAKKKYATKRICFTEIYRDAHMLHLDINEETSFVTRPKLLGLLLVSIVASANREQFVNDYCVDLTSNQAPVNS